MRRLIRYFGRLLYVAIVRVEMILDLDNRIVASRQREMQAAMDAVNAETYTNSRYKNERINHMMGYIHGPNLATRILEGFAWLYPEYDGEYFYQVPFWN